MNNAAIVSVLKDTRLHPWLLLLLGLCVLYIPSFYDLATTLWRADNQAHAPLVLIIAVWLIAQNWKKIVLPDGDVLRTRGAFGWPIVVFSLLMYVVGRSQGIIIFEIGSLISLLIGSILVFRGFAELRVIWFALFFMLFMLPLPGDFVAAVTQPMKIAVSYATEALLYHLGYPVARAGVILNIGQYQLQVADACAGLQTLFTLESMGLLYLNIVQHSSAMRNIVLAVLIIPISFFANVIRVCSLTLITYYFGDEVGQGFFHKFAGMVLYLSALLLIISTDSLLRVWDAKRKQEKIHAI
jgi:exosortase B